MRSFVLIFILILFAVPAGAREIADREIPEVLTLDNGTSLQLNGAGIRYKLFFKIYIAELYLQYPSSDPEKVIGATGLKRIVMDFLYDEVPREKLVDGWNEGFEENLSKEEFAAIEARIDGFNKMFSDVKKGDTIVLDYGPEKGTEVIIRGESLGVIPGKDFNDALLRIWLGKAPVSNDLRDQLLASKAKKDE